MKKILSVIILLSFMVSAGYCQEQKQGVADNAKYEILFKKYLDLIGKPAREKNSGEIEKLSQQFVDQHKDFRIAEIYIWNRELKTKNNLLFQKTYLSSDVSGGMIVYPKIHYLDNSKIHVNELQQENQKYMLLTYESYALDIISCRMVIFINGVE